MKIKQLACTNMPVLIQGDTGTGKSYLAKKIHNQSNRSLKPFKQVNIASLTDSLFESEIFGHVKGSFSGAQWDKIGFCESVKDGTLFLDEIGELSLSQQASLLTLIDEGLFYKVGDTKEKRFNGRLIFATNKNLQKLVSLGEFREDLFYRLRLCVVNLPSLKDSLNIDQIIIEEFNQLKVIHNIYNKRLNSEVIEVLSSYNWPGNYRELKNTLVYLLHAESEIITINDMPSWVCEKSYESFDSIIFKDALAHFEEKFLINCLKKFNGKINLTSEQTGINKVTLISKLKKYDINRKLYINYANRQANGF